MGILMKWAVRTAGPIAVFFLKNNKMNSSKGCRIYSSLYLSTCVFMKRKRGGVRRRKETFVLIDIDI
jgi:hypothetical protein